MDSPIKFNLALQGGGAHGAFTWGVLDRLLAEKNVEITGISGTSAGAMNAAALKCGWVKNGANGAREALNSYWEKVKNYSRTPSDFEESVNFFAGPFAEIFKEGIRDNLISQGLNQMATYWSPYDINPLNINILREIVEDEFSEKALRSPEGPKLFVNATNVRTGKIKVFMDKNLSHEAILASAALPTLFHAVKIKGEHYWDGGYTGNPALFPLIDGTDCGDIVIIHINPLKRNELPVSASAIENRINEISFNTPLLNELRHIEFIDRLLDENRVDIAKFKRLRIHSISDDKTMTELDVTTKISADRGLIEELFEKGRISANKFLKKQKGNIGISSSVNLRSTFES